MTTQDDAQGKIEGWDTFKHKFDSQPKLVKNITLFNDAKELKKSVACDLVNKEANPELERVAYVRQGNELSEEEIKFVEIRKRKARESFAKFIGVDPSEVHEDDIPVIAVTGSGGGMRSNIDTFGYVRGMKKAGLWDCVTYFTGVSGACWGIATYYTVSSGSVDSTIEQFKRAYFFRKDEKLDPKDFKLSLQKKLVETGEHPMPIYVAVRHERPWKDVQEAQEIDNGIDEDLDEFDDKEHGNKKSWFQWVEFTPFEIGNDEIAAYIPSWAFGRSFDKGQSIDKVPEQNFGLELGYMTNAQSAPTQRYVHLADRELPANWLGKEIRQASTNIGERLGSHRIDELESHHPIHTGRDPNPFHLLRDPPYEPGILTADYLRLLDAGMDNNHPWYVLTRANRNVDVILTVDGSKETMHNDFFDRMANQFLSRRGIRFTLQSPPTRPSIPQTLTPELRGKPDAIHETFKDAYVQVYQCEPVDERGESVIQGRDVRLVYMPNLPCKKYPEFDPINDKICATSNFVFSENDIDTIVGCAEGCWEESLETVRETLRSVWESKKKNRMGGQ
ncbi:9661_t:CDS:10 [Paraglomus brasilianum]|uniref:Lysophospholipase n=1 Tax=Paraglomus brasilianum TaxID=144538 RepID=A0A9N8ZLI2_9GLOM|nr:9661_t:CDS:10 [Paraglomus brasilianum]